MGMRLLICASEYYPNGSGIANVAYNIVEEMKKSGVNCTVCSPIGPDIKLGNPELINKYGIIGLVYYWSEVSKFLELNQTKFDAVWCHNPLFIKKCSYKNIIVTIHTTYYGEFIHNVGYLHFRIYKKFASIVEKYCLHNLSHSVPFNVVSPKVAKELESIGIEKQRISYIPNGVNTSLFKPSENKTSLKQKFGFPEDSRIILSLGRLTEQKDPIILIKIFGEVSVRINNVILVIAGQGELLNKTRELVQKNNLNNVIFLGYVDEANKPDLYACSDFYILTSKYEGQPLTLLEAMSSGLACIVSDIPNLDIVADARCGIIISCSDTQIAAKSIVKYIKENHLSHNSNSRKYAENNLGWNVISDKYLKEFRGYSNL
ncbi:MAG: glycosyltransferase family 4 protein [Methanosarcina sp.]|nr:glycosyltransferase family 4 protein [Methanosarcina sp.]